MTDVIKGKYRIVREIARSNDIVYEAVDTSLFNRRVAIKELNIGPSLTGQARRDRVERFHREARATSSLSHPNIVSVLDFGEENGRHFIVMEFLEGQTLRDAMQARGIYSVRDALDVISQVLDALGHAHSRRVIHRDIKPDNIYILPGGQVKLTDFGIARLSGEPGLTMDGQVFGTPSYMSPEQIEGKPLDQRSDLFSVGVLLYEMLAGRKPFVGDSVVAITYAIMNADPPSLYGVPGGVEQVIRRALSKQPMMRPNSAEEMKQQLRAGEQSAPLMSQSSISQMGGTMGGRTGANPSYQGMPQSSAPPMQAPPPSWAGAPPSMPSNPGPPTGYAPAPQSSVPGALPWSWNGAQHPAGVQGGAQAPPGVPLGAVPGRPQYKPLNSAPLFILGPGARTNLKVLITTLLGGIALASIILMMKNFYEKYQADATLQQVTTLINRGATAYQSGDYSTAITDFKQALESHPNDTQSKTSKWNLAYTYVQLAIAARKRGSLNDARDAYLEALNVESDYSQAHQGLAEVLTQLGDTSGARDQQDAAKGGVSQAPPANLKDAPVPQAAANTNASYMTDSTATGDVNEVSNRRAEARSLIEEGDELNKNGHPEEARSKWLDAIEKAPGYPEEVDANNRLQQNTPPPDSEN